MLQLNHANYTILVFRLRCVHLLFLLIMRTATTRDNTSITTGMMTITICVPPLVVSLTVDTPVKSTYGLFLRKQSQILKHTGFGYCCYQMCGWKRLPHSTAAVDQQWISASHGEEEQNVLPVQLLFSLPPLQISVGAVCFTSVRVSD